MGLLGKPQVPPDSVSVSSKSKDPLLGCGPRPDTVFVSKEGEGAQTRSHRNPTFRIIAAATAVEP